MLAPLEANGEGCVAVSVGGEEGNDLGQSPISSEAESEAVFGDVGLEALAEAWPTLPVAIKAGRLAMGSRRRVKPLALKPREST